MTGSPEKAALAYFVSAHPASRFADKTRVGARLAELERQLYPQALTEAREKSKGSTPRAVAKTLLERSLHLEPAAARDDGGVAEKPHEKL